MIRAGWCRIVRKSVSPCSTCITRCGYYADAVPLAAVYAVLHRKFLRVALRGCFPVEYDGPLPGLAREAFPDYRENGIAIGGISSLRVYDVYSQ